MSEITHEEVTDIVDRIISYGPSAMFRVLAQLEHRCEFVSALVLRSDVEDIYRQMWEYEGNETKEMTDEEWARFKQEWFWRKGHSEVMWEDVENAIRTDFRDMAIVPEEAVID